MASIWHDGRFPIEAFNEFAKGVLGFRDIVFFLSFIAFFLFATAIAIRAKRA